MNRWEVRIVKSAPGDNLLEGYVPRRYFTKWDAKRFAKEYAAKGGELTIVRESHRRPTIRGDEMIRDRVVGAFIEG